MNISLIFYITVELFYQYEELKPRHILPHTFPFPTPHKLGRNRTGEIMAAGHSAAAETH